MKIKTKYLCLIGLMTLALALLIITYIGYATAARDLEVAQKNRFDS